MFAIASIPLILTTLLIFTFMSVLKILRNSMILIQSERFVLHHPLASKQNAKAQAKQVLEITNKTEYRKENAQSVVSIRVKFETESYDKSVWMFLLQSAKVFWGYVWMQF